MGYCTAADIQKDFPGVTFDTTTKVKLADIDDFILDADALIDSFAAGKYAVPVTGARSLAVVKFYSRSLVADKIRSILQIKQSTNQGVNQNVRDGMTTNDIIKLLAKLPTEESQLSDAPLILDNGGISSFNAKNGVTTEFKKDTPSW